MVTENGRLEPQTETQANRDTGVGVTTHGRAPWYRAIAINVRDGVRVALRPRAYERPRALGPRVLSGAGGLKIGPFVLEGRHCTIGRLVVLE
jgi:hypothetical protein